MRFRRSVRKASWFPQNMPWAKRVEEVLFDSIPASSRESIPDMLAEAIEGRCHGESIALECSASSSPEFEVLYEVEEHA